jgi:hypothetical protein
MKRFMVCVLLAFSVVALASAQGRDRWDRRDFPRPQQLPTEQVTVTGNITIVQGSPAVKAGDLTYLVPGLLRYVGFIDSLKDGASVTLAGAAITYPQDAKIKVLRVSRLTVGGKDYDLARPAVPTTQPMMPRAHHGWGW